MTDRYERAYGTDWDALDRDEAIDRAYALGVAAAMGEYHPDELDAVRAEVYTTYARSVVDLAFDEGRTEAQGLESEDGETAWTELVEGETAVVDPADGPIGGRTGLPEALALADVLDQRIPDSTDVVDRPEFLERD